MSADVMNPETSWSHHSRPLGSSIKRTPELWFSEVVFPLQTQVIINTHKQFCLSCQPYKRVINKYNPLPVRAFVERKQLEMALSPDIVCQQLPNRTMVTCWRLLEKRAGHVTHMKETVFSLKVLNGHYGPLCSFHTGRMPLHFLVFTVHVSD